MIWCFWEPQSTWRVLTWLCPCLFASVVLDFGNLAQVLDRMIIHATQSTQYADPTVMLWDSVYFLRWLFLVPSCCDLRFVRASGLAGWGSRFQTCIPISLVSGLTIPLPKPVQTVPMMRMWPDQGETPLPERPWRTHFNHSHDRHHTPCSMMAASSVAIHSFKCGPTLQVERGRAVRHESHPS